MVCVWLCLSLGKRNWFLDVVQNRAAEKRAKKTEEKKEKRNFVWAERGVWEGRMDGWMDLKEGMVQN